MAAALQSIREFAKFRKNFDGVDGSANGNGYLPRRTPIKTGLLLQSLELPNRVTVTHYPQLSLAVKCWATVGQQCQYERALREVTIHESRTGTLTKRLLSCLISTGASAKRSEKKTRCSGCADVEAPFFTNCVCSLWKQASPSNRYVAQCQSARTPTFNVDCYPPECSDCTGRSRVRS